MPLPDEPLVVEGGCNCGAIRYKATIPAWSERPIYPGGGDAVTPKEVRMPVLATCHCNDCRAALGAILPFWMCTPLDMVSMSCIPTASLPKDGKLDRSKVAHSSWRPAAELMEAAEADPSLPLTFFASSKSRRRSFCNHCGTMFSYQVFPSPDWWPSDWPKMLDLVLGTLDRQYLDSDNFAPERHMWWNCGVDWIRKFALEGAGHLPAHPTFKVNEEVSKS